MKRNTIILLLIWLLLFSGYFLAIYSESISINKWNLNELMPWGFSKYFPFSFKEIWWDVDLLRHNSMPVAPKYYNPTNFLVVMDLVFCLLALLSIFSRLKRKTAIIFLRIYFFCQLLFCLGITFIEFFMLRNYRDLDIQFILKPYWKSVYLPRVIYLIVSVYALRILF
jgi:hypothetical protein